MVREASPRNYAIIATRVLLVLACLAQVGFNRKWLDVPLPHRSLFFDAPFILAAIACWHRSRRGGRDSTAWLAQAVALLMWDVGAPYLAYIAHYAADYPSIADAFWLSFYVLTYVAIALFTRAHLTNFLPSTWLDGAIAGLGATALVASLGFAPALSRFEGEFSAVATNLAYPVADLVLLALLVCVGHALRGHGPSWWMLTSGLGLFFIGDVRYLYGISTGGGALPSRNIFALGWTVGVTIIGLAATLKEHRREPRDSDAHRYVVPSFFAISTIGLLLYGQREHLPVAALLFISVTLVLVAVRLILTTREVRDLSRSRTEARTDYLTGLPNRRLLAERLEAEVAREGTPTSLLVIDLDRFKEVNDSLGHLAGDELLRQVGRRLTEQMGPNDLLTRLGGDEFAVVLPNRGTEDATAVAHSVRDALRMPFQVADVLVIAQASIGVASAPEHGRTAAELLVNADIAMYQAKSSSMEVAAFRVRADNPSRDRLQLLTDLRQALESDQFVLHYQPQLNLRTGSVYGVEALVRWEHPQRGLLNPHEFLPMVGETRLMMALTESVLRQASSDWAHLRASGLPMRMSVNISATDLLNPALPECIEAFFATQTAEFGQLVLELTEDAVIADRARSHDVLQQMRDAGALISIDDYGTGQASLAYLRDLPLDEIKLGRPFVTGTPADTHSAAIVRSTIELAHALGLPLVAEGVEDEATLEWLGDLGCDAAQGFHIGRPMPRADLEEWLSVNAVV